LAPTMLMGSCTIEILGNAKGELLVYPNCFNDGKEDGTAEEAFEGIVEGISEGESLADVERKLLRLGTIEILGNAEGVSLAFADGFNDGKEDSKEDGHKNGTAEEAFVEGIVRRRIAHRNTWGI